MFSPYNLQILVTLEEAVCLVSVLKLTLYVKTVRAFVKQVTEIMMLFVYKV